MARGNPRHEPGRPVRPLHTQRRHRIPDGPLTGIEEAGIDADSPAEWFDLQGMRLAAPEKGRIVIVRQGGKTRKTVF